MVKNTRKHSRNDSLRALARKHPHSEHVGFMWKDPLNKKSKGIRWTRRNLNTFRKFQKSFHK